MDGLLYLARHGFFEYPLYKTEHHFAAVERKFAVDELHGKFARGDLLLADGNRTPDVDIECRAIIKGDAKIPEIMAASILAKNERDRIMVLCDRKWPGYGYAKHKGYPSPEHRKRIAELGPSPIERMTFNAGTVTRNDEQPELF